MYGCVKKRKFVLGKILAKSLTTVFDSDKLNKSVDGDGPARFFSESARLVKGRKTGGQAHHPGVCADIRRAG